LRKLAAQKLAQEKPGLTLQATALVHEAYMRLVDVEKAQHWNSRGHFFAAAAEAMRRILVEQARHRKSAKAGGQRQRVPLAGGHWGARSGNMALSPVEEAFDWRASQNSRRGELVKLGFFAGMPIAGAAAALGVAE